MLSIEKVFRLRENHTTFRREIIGGLTIGFISYPLLKALSGQAKKVHWLIYVLAGLFILRYIFLPL